MSPVFFALLQAILSLFSKVKAKYFFFPWSFLNFIVDRHKFI